MNLTLERARSPTYPNLSPLAQDVLRVTAITTMVLDHLNKAFFNSDITLFTLAGRLAFPLFALLIAHNIHARGVPWQRYVAPLLIAGVAAQLPFMTLFQPLLNTMFTLLLGVLIAPTSVWLDSKLGKGSGAFAWVLLALPNLLMDYPLFGAWLVPLAGFLGVQGLVELDTVPRGGTVFQSVHPPIVRVAAATGSRCGAARGQTPVCAALGLVRVLPRASVRDRRVGQAVKRVFLCLPKEDESQYHVLAQHHILEAIQHDAAPFAPSLYAGVLAGELERREGLLCSLAFLQVCDEV